MPTKTNRQRWECDRQYKHKSTQSFRNAVVGERLLSGAVACANPSLPVLASPSALIAKVLRQLPLRRHQRPVIFERAQQQLYLGISLLIDDSTASK
ncbi:hypothetical protein AB4142_19355 [Variovorax sp. 2RAF20]